MLSKNESNSGISALENFFTAAKTGNIVKVQEYLNNGIDINAKDKKGNTILTIASDIDNCF